MDDYLSQFDDSRSVQSHNNVAKKEKIETNATDAEDTERNEQLKASGGKLPNLYENEKSQHIVWKKDFDVGHEMVDSQHKKLVDLLSQLNESVLNKEERFISGIIINDLLDYTVYHFSAEEQLMESFAYPAIEGHKAIHKKLVQQALLMRQKYQNCEANIDTLLLEFLKEWLTTHILFTDRKMVAYITSKRNANK